MPPVNCFGKEVNNKTLEELGLPKTRENLSRVAMSVMLDDDRKGQATRYVHSQKQLYGNGVSTLCLVYNATGDNLIKRANKDWWSGSLYGPDYPSIILNGQWAAFLHVHSEGAASGSLGAVVYQGTSLKRSELDFLIAWSTPWSEVYSNTAYCEIGDNDFWDDHWDEIEQKLASSRNIWNSTFEGAEIDAETEPGSTSPEFTAVIRIITPAELSEP